MKFKLERSSDKKGLIGNMLKTYIVSGKGYDKILGDNSGNYTSENIPNLNEIVKINHCIDIISNNDNWMTTAVLKKLESKKDYIKFETEHSEYILSIIY